MKSHKKLRKKFHEKSGKKKVPTVATSGLWFKTNLPKQVLWKVAIALQHVNGKLLTVTSKCNKRTVACL